MNLLNKIKNMGDSHESSGVSQDWYIVAEGARGISDEDTISKSDPYLKIEFGGNEVKTRSVKNDRSPSWNETFHFKLNSGQLKDIHIRLMDDDIGFDDSLGTATISKAELPTMSGEEKLLKVPVFKNDQITAMVNLRVRQTTDGQLHSQQSYQSSTNYPQQQFQQPYNQTQPMMNQQQPYNQFQQQQQPYQQQQQPYHQQQQQPYQQQQQPYHQQQQQPYNQQSGGSQGQQSYNNNPQSYYGRR